MGSVAAWKGHEPIVVSGSTDGTIKAWNTQTGSLLTTGEGHMRDVWAVAVTTGPRPLIVSGSFDRTIRVWDINPIIAELNWSRRQNFVYFLRSAGFLPSREEQKISSSLSYGVGLKDEEEEGEEGEENGEGKGQDDFLRNLMRLIAKVFEDRDLCRIVASYI